MSKLAAFLNQKIDPNDRYPITSFIAKVCHLDLLLLLGVMLVCITGLIILYSAASADLGIVLRQATRLGMAIAIMLLFAQISPQRWVRWAPYWYGVSLCLLAAVLALGVVGKGAQRWLDLKFIRCQPSELMKFAIPLCLAWYFDRKPLPPTWQQLTIASLLIVLPVAMTIKQPDLGTAIMLATSGIWVLFLAGIRWRIILSIVLMSTLAAPILWLCMHDYQRQRILTFLDPERDPLGTGYHIIQSKIAIGSGGLTGKGWMEGTQSQLDYLPEHTTDFIFAVGSEEFGLIGVGILLALYLFIVIRCLYISMHAQTSFGRLLVGSLGLTFFFSYFVNIGMVSGLLPVVGVPLPLVSYGGTSMLTIFAGFGVIMSVYTHRSLIEH